MVINSSSLFLLQLLAGRKSTTSHNTGWNYDDTNRWPEQYPSCGGYRQSPINLDSFNYIGLDREPLIFQNYGHTFGEKLTMVNNGHTATINIPTTIWGTRPGISGGLLQGLYEAQSLHFHWGSPGGVKGSEHTINGRRFDMEMHIVHKNVQYPTMGEAMKHADGIAVLGVMLKIVNRIEKLYPGLYITFNELPKITEAHSNTTINPLLSLDHFLGDIYTDGFYAYRGSLTTPPCSEAVIWHVLPKPIRIKQAKIHNFFKLKREDGSPLINNFRPTQSLNGRYIYKDIDALQPEIYV